MDNKEWEVSAAQIKKAHGYSTPDGSRRLGETAREAAALAREILRLSRDALLINLRFLESALIKFIPENDTVTAEMATDGRLLYYNSVHVCRRFQQGRRIPARDYLHITLHCLFRHLFVGAKVNPDLWDLACDITVENVITGLGIKSLYCEREERQAWLIRKLRGELPHLSAERVYRWLREQSFPIIECERLRADFYADDHKIWYKLPELASGSGRGEVRDNAVPQDDEKSNSGSLEDQGEELPPPVSGEEEESAQGGGTAAEKKPGGERGDSAARSGEEEKSHEPAMAPKETEEMWREIARRIEVDLDTVSNSWGENAGGLTQTLAAINREKCDYAAFLRRFAVTGENMEVNDEEFDYIFYTYGLSLYKRMPLIEALEYKEVRRVREFVIALDTSESVAGELVQKFVEKTWNILRQTENFFTKVNVHIIQCGARVEEDAKITSQDEFEAYIGGMTLKGFGGTDFRPLFEYVDGLIKRHEFTAFKGLIYFTDGYGDFPAMPPDYETAFVFIDQGRRPPEVPVWAMRLLLGEDEIEELRVENHRR